MTMPTTTSHAYSPIFSSANEERSDDSSGDDCAHPSFKNRLAEIPGEVLIEIMKWISLSEGAETSVLSLGCTSKQFSTALKEFGVNSWVRENTLSGKLHKYTTDWVHWHLDTLGSRPRQLNTNSLEKLQHELISIGETTRSIKTETCTYPLYVNEKFKAICNGDWLGAFQTFSGHTLSVNTAGENFSLDFILQIEKALPSHTAMQVIVQKFFTPLNDAALAEFIKKLCAGQRPVSFEFAYVEFDKYPLAQKALTDTLCGQGFIMELFFTGDAGNDNLLRALATCCNQLRHVQLISVEGLTHINDEAIEGFAEALERRRDNGGSHVSIALSGVRSDTPELKSKLSFSNEKIAYFETLGLYFGMLDGSLKGSFSVPKVSASIGHGPTYLLRSKTLPTVVEADSDDDSIVAGSDDDSIIVSREDELSSNESEEEIPVQPQRKPARPSQAEPASEPKVKKRDKCVIS